MSDEDADFKRVFPNCTQRVGLALGERAYWHLAGFDAGPIDRSVEQINEAMQAGKISPIIAKLMSLELTMEFAKAGRPIPVELIILLAHFMKLPDAALVFPEAYYAGRTKRIRKLEEQQRLTVQYLDVQYAQVHGVRISVKKAAAHAAKLLRRHSPLSEKSVRIWLNEARHGEVVETVIESRKFYTAE